MTIEPQELEINHLRAEGVPWKYGMVWPVDDVTPILVMPRHVISAVSRISNLPIKVIMGNRQDRRASHVRQMAMLIMRETQPDMNIMKIARFFGRDHSSINHGIKVARSRVQRTGLARKQYKQICQELGVQPNEGNWA